LQNYYSYGKNSFDFTGSCFAASLFAQLSSAIRVLFETIVPLNLFMKLSFTIALGILIGNYANYNTNCANYASCAECRNHTSYRQYVFVIDIEYRSQQEAVERPANWRFLGNAADNIPYCGPGVRQACQLIVDERDTDPSATNKNERILKPTVHIDALLNKKAGTWFVNGYTPAGKYYYEILNEEDEK
jgi:hypothetical protein